MSGKYECNLRSFQNKGAEKRTYLHFDMFIDGFNEHELRFFFEEGITKLKESGALPKDAGDITDWIKA